ncbi:hypothetical protein BC831DRAFT_515246 [Entophlyctis helioformis]|nr:hypothetical protein BC831DRAFT_515246 [Entophlyctis helioformis]
MSPEQQRRQQSRKLQQSDGANMVQTPALHLLMSRLDFDHSESLSPLFPLSPTSLPTAPVLPLLPMPGTTSNASRPSFERSMSDELLRSGESTPTQAQSRSPATAAGQPSHHFLLQPHSCISIRVTSVSGILQRGPLQPLSIPASKLPLASPPVLDLAPVQPAPLLDSMPQPVFARLIAVLNICVWIIIVPSPSASRSRPISSCPNGSCSRSRSSDIVSLIRTISTRKPDRIARDSPRAQQATAYQPIATQTCMINGSSGMALSLRQGSAFARSEAPLAVKATDGNSANRASHTNSGNDPDASYLSQPGQASFLSARGSMQAQADQPYPFYAAKPLMVPFDASLLALDGGVDCDALRRVVDGRVQETLRLLESFDKVFGLL